MAQRISKVLAAMAVVATVSLISGLKPGGSSAPADRTWMVALSKSNSVLFWRTHTVGEKVEIYDACDRDGKPNATAVGNKDGSWALDGKYGNLSARIDAKTGQLQLTLQGSEYGTGQRIAAVTCENGRPKGKLTPIVVSEGEQSFAAVGQPNDLEVSRGVLLPVDRSPVPTPIAQTPDTSDLLPSGETYTCRNMAIPLNEVRQLANVPVLGPDLEIWPGNLIQGKSYATGVFAPISIERAGGTVSVTGINFDGDAKSSIPLSVMSQQNVKRGIEKILSQKIVSSEANAEFRAEVVYNDDQMAYSLGVDGRFLRTLGDAIRLDTTPGKSNVLVRLRQTYYTASFKDPETAASVFRDNNMLKDPKNEIGADNPPIYIKSVGYGRVIFVLVSSPYEGSAVLAALQAAKEGKSDGTVLSGGVPVTFNQILTASTVAYTVQGGKDIPTLGKMGKVSGIDNLFEAIKSTLNEIKPPQISEFGDAVPVSYSLSYLTSRATAMMGFASAYNFKACTKSPKKYSTFGLLMTCIDDRAEVWLEAPNGTRIDLFNGGGNPGYMDVSQAIPADQMDGTFVLRLMDHNSGGPSCLHFQLTRNQYVPSSSYTGLDDNGNMISVGGGSPQVHTGGSWLIQAVSDTKIRINRGTGEVTLLQR